EAKAARAAFNGALNLDVRPSEPLEAMVKARRAALAALCGEDREARALATSLAETASVHVTFLEAWDRIFLGWAQRLLGQWEEAAANLEAAREFFSRVKVPPPGVPPPPPLPPPPPPPHT